MLHETGSGLFAYPKGYPISLSKDATGIHLPCCDDVENRIRQMRSDNGLLDSTKMLVLISLATNEMVKYMCMYLNVWYMDCTSGTNREKNLTVIPSAQKWLFETIYKTAFPNLYSPDVCSMNRLVLTDEEKAEYEPFQLAIETTDYFQQSKVMLCTFHAIWMSFKVDLYPVLDNIPHGGALREFAYCYSMLFSILCFEHSPLIFLHA